MAALIVYAALGLKIAPFHGDEAMHIYTSTDYTTAFIDHQVQNLPVNPPYDIDGDARLRLLNGSVMRYTVGFIMQLNGLTKQDLPPRPGWDWGLHYADDVATGHMPMDALLTAGRTAALVYFALSIIAMFGIGWQFGGRWTAYIASALYTLNPIILVNGRRALVESALLGFGLLTIWVALQIAQKLTPPPAPLPAGKEGEPIRSNGLWGWWIALIITSALTLVSKYSGTIFVAGAFGGVFIVEVVRVFRVKRPFGNLISSTLKLTVSGLLALVLTVALSPALWNNPISRVQDLTQMLQEQVTIVVSILSPEAPTTIPQRVEGIITQPFMTPVAYFEQASWAEAKPVTDSIAAYESSPLSGLPVNPITGILLTLLAAIGLTATVWPRIRPYEAWSLSAVLIVWLLITLLNLLINPLPWQRYYLPLIPIDTLLAAIGVMSIVKIIRQRRMSQ
ncbi:MAG: phospholipid carrier-dependent glycosyltransferase [Anaerolineaceae bacterium]|nr:phospholipid carrier-dependent glycosyltransferase [Anaerolineaceae bacterium]